MGTAFPGVGAKLLGPESGNVWWEQKSYSWAVPVMVGRAGAGASLRGSSAALPVTAWGNKEMLLQHREGCSCE